MRRAVGNYSAMGLRVVVVLAAVSLAAALPAGAGTLPATSQPIAPDTVEPSLSWHEASVCGAGSVPAPAGRATASETAARTTTTRRPIAE